MDQASPTLCVYLLHDTTITLWGLSSRQRLERMLKRVARFRFIEDPASVPPDGTVLLIRGDYLYDDRVIRSLVKAENVIVQARSASGHVPVAAHVAAGRSRDVLNFFHSPAAEGAPPGIRVETPETVSPSFQQQLRKSEPPFILPITEQETLALEQRLFSWSYKGVTDLVTKWAWPRPAQWCTRVCARQGITPNQVTFFGFLLVIVATALFVQGEFGWGLAAGWIMTFLDTVDGKLARVTVTSSRFGHLFDHIIDILHPPIWYAAWAIGAKGYGGIPLLSMSAVLWIIIIGYIAGRLVELAFKQWLGSFGIFCWQPVDSFFRLITARRNPNLILLTAPAASGHPGFGLLGVAFWTAATSLFLLVRLSSAAFLSLSAGPLQSWLMNVDQEPYRYTLAARLFANQPAAKDRMR